MGQPCKECGIVLDSENAARNKIVKGVVYYKTYCRHCISIKHSDYVKCNPIIREKRLVYYKAYNQKRSKKGKYDCENM